MNIAEPCRRNTAFTRWAIAMLAALAWGMGCAPGKPAVEIPKAAETSASLGAKAVLGHWVGSHVCSKNGKAERLTVLLGLLPGGKGAIGVIDASGADYPFVGLWKLDDAHLVFSQDPAQEGEYRDITTPFKVRVISATRDKLQIGPADYFEMKPQEMIELHRATAEEIDRYYHGDKPDVVPPA